MKCSFKTACSFWMACVVILPLYHWWKVHLSWHDDARNHTSSYVHLSPPDQVVTSVFVASGPRALRKNCGWGLRLWPGTQSVGCDVHHHSRLYWTYNYALYFTQYRHMIFIYTYNYMQLCAMIYNYAIIYDVCHSLCIHITILTMSWVNNHNQFYTATVGCD